MISVRLRSHPANLAVDEVKAMIKKLDFFDRYKNKNGIGFANQFETKVLNDDKVVIDRASGLIWQQGGSSEYMKYEEAKNWVKELNRKGYAGYYDWRFPTLEEAMSLMKPENKKEDLYIEPVFDKEKKWIWTSDLLRGGSKAWVALFVVGSCHYELFSYDNYVRAVRSGQSSGK